MNDTKNRKVFAVVGGLAYNGSLHILRLFLVQIKP